MFFEVSVLAMRYNYKSFSISYLNCVFHCRSPKFYSYFSIKLWVNLAIATLLHFYYLIYL